jgi:hypothetical protein
MDATGPRQLRRQRAPERPATSSAFHPRQTVEAACAGAMKRGWPFRADRVQMLRTRRPLLPRSGACDGRCSVGVLESEAEVIRARLIATGWRAVDRMDTRRVGHLVLRTRRFVPDRVGAAASPASPGDLLLTGRVRS